VVADGDSDGSFDEGSTEGVTVGVSDGSILRRADGENEGSSVGT